MRLILASQSPYRKQQLENLGIAFVPHAPLVDEEALKNNSLAPEELAIFLAQSKANSLANTFPSDWILGADQLVAFQNSILGKPGSAEKAQMQLAQMQGKSHTLITAFFLLGPQGKSFQHVDRTTLRMRSLSSHEIESYVKKDKPLDCAGAYKLEKAGIALFEKIESEDFSAIQGLPLIALTKCWRQATGMLPFDLT